MTEKKLRIWLLTNAPSPYQMEYLAAIGQHMQMDVRLMRGNLAGAAWNEGELPSGAQIMPAWGSGKWRDECRVHPGALREVRSGTYDAYVLSGVYTSPTFLLCALILHWQRKKWAVWFERPWPDDYRPDWARRASARSGIARFLRRKILGWLLAKADRVFCIGSAAVEAYRDWGGPGDKLVFMPYVCDLQPFRQAGREPAERIRFLYVGLLVKRKGVDLLMTAFQRLAAENAAVELVVAGSGPMETELRSMVSDRVRFSGSVKRDDLPALYGDADVFVFPSRHDGWGVVINEACGAGLPVIVTSSTGAAADLVADGVNGIVVPRDDPESLYQAMRFLADHPESRAAFGARSREKSALVDIPTGVDRFVRAVEDLSG
ncbi:MAG: glycosyltransferase family 4 protein [Kiritimatiellia bacterium]